MRYNQAVQPYNQTIRTFPNSLLARALNFPDKPFFKAMNSAAPTIPER
jgi:LemA protein